MSVLETAELVDLPVDAVEKLKSIQSAGRAALQPMVRAEAGAALQERHRSRLSS